MNQDIIDNFKGAKVMVIGDVMLDKYLTGKIDRISPEAPVPIVSLKNRDARLGGAANVALSLKALDAEPILFSIIGQDENGSILKKLVEEQSISADYLLGSASRKTTVKSRILASNQQILRVDEEDTHPLSDEEEHKLLDAISRRLKDGDISVIIFQDYNKGMLTPTLIQEVIHIAKTHSIPTVVDPKRENFWSYQGVTCFKPNLKEIRDALAIDIQANIEDLSKVHARLHETLQNDISLITLSEHGVFYGTNKTNLLEPTISRKIADVCGAGDAVLAVVSLCLATNVSPQIICKLANMAGGQVCESVGVVPINKSDLCREFGKSSV